MNSTTVLLPSITENADDDDVIFIEPKPVEVINVDPELDKTEVIINMSSKELADADANHLKSPNTSATSSSASSSKEIAIASKNRARKSLQSNMEHERNELLSTPDSAMSNDFIDNSLISEKQKFNFGLHEMDLRSANKQKLQSELYETESSCSASDFGTPSKPPRSIFMENEFETPGQQLFSEGNLQSFSDFITPRRPNSASNDPENESSIYQKDSNMSNNVTENEANSSDSSSESEYSEAGSTKATPKKRNRLPSLAAISPSDVISTSTGKKGKKRKPKRNTPIKEAGINETNETTAEGDSGNNKNKRKSQDSLMNIPKKKSKGKILDINTEENEQNTDNVHAETSNVSANDEPVSSTEFRVENLNTFAECVGDFMTERDCDVSISDEPISSSKTEFKVEKLDAENTNLLRTNSILSCENLVISSDDDEIEIIEPQIPMLEVSEEDDDIVDLNIETDLSFANCSYIKQVESAQYDPDLAASSPTEKKNFSDYYTPDMNKFYFSSWGLEDFSVTRAQSKMSDDPELWKIIDRDRMQIKLSRPKGPRCLRCRRRGHISVDCDNKVSATICRLCGKKGHQENRCKNKLCSNCAKKGMYFNVYCNNCSNDREVRCKICKNQGHTPNRCADLWRRYIYTTSEGNPVEFNTKLKPAVKRWCSGCGHRGHFEFQCNGYNRKYFPVNSMVRSFEDVYSQGFDPFKTFEVQMRRLVDRKKETSSVTNDTVVENMFAKVPQAIVQPPQTATSSNTNENASFCNWILADHSGNNTNVLPPKRPVVDNITKTIVNTPPPPIISMSDSSSSNYNSNMNKINFASCNSSVNYVALEDNIVPNPVASSSFKPPVRIQRQIQNDYVQSTQSQSENVLAVNDSSIVYYLNESDAEFLQSQLPGKEFLRDVERDLHVAISIIIDRVTKTSYIRINGSREHCNFAREIIDRYVQSEMLDVKIPPNSKKTLKFLQRALFKCVRNCDPQLLLINLLNMKLDIEGENNGKKLCHMRVQLRNLYMQLNVSFFSKYNIDQSFKHMETLNSAKDAFHELPAHVVSLANCHDLQHSFNFIFYNKRSIEEYENCLEYLRNVEHSSFNIEYRNKNAVIYATQQIKNKMNHFRSFKKKEALPKALVNELSKCYEHFMDDPNLYLFDKFMTYHKYFVSCTKKVFAKNAK